MKLRHLLAVIAATILISLVGQSDHEDAIIAENHYSEMVCSGHWPDYENLQPVCEVKND
jgi:hypothetical protein